MKGKIFPSSDNLNQDQAQILFDYYRQSAEKIVREEERIEGEIAKLKERKKILEEQESKLWYWFLTIILFFVYFIKKNAIQKSRLKSTSVLQNLKKCIRRFSVTTRYQSWV